LSYASEAHRRLGTVEGALRGHL